MNRVAVIAVTVAMLFTATVGHAVELVVDTVQPMLVIDLHAYVPDADELDLVAVDLEADAETCLQPGRDMVTELDPGVRRWRGQR